MKKILIILIVIISIGAVVYISTKDSKINKKDNGIVINSKEGIEEKKENITLNKNIIFFGDSITYGHLTKGYSWVNYIDDNYDFNIVKNAGISDYRVSTYDDPNKWLVSQVKSYVSEEFDYVIMQGGVNDLLYLTPLGEISSGFDEASFNPNTFAGGLELYISTVKNNWSNAKIGYILTYYTPNYTERGLKWSYDDYNKYIVLTKNILEKWDIKYLDLFDQKYSDLLRVDTKEYLPDYLHLNDSGYRLIFPDIYEWIKLL